MKLDEIIEKIKQISGNVYGREREELLQKKILNFQKKYSVNIEQVFSDEKLTSLFIDAVLVKETSFFRHKEQLFEFRELYLKQLLKDGSVRILSAGCSTGKEAYTLGMITLSVKPETDRISIEGMDLSEMALSVARKGIYSIDKLREIPVEYRKFVQVHENYIEMTDRLKNITTFRKGNILNRSDFPEQYYDAVFCRNVFIYFAPEHVAYVLYNFHKTLKKNGVLVISPVEFLPEKGKKYFTPEKIGRFVFYRKI
ncbi:CheR family methyltransferase [Persephonella sp.]